jgi:hypothetical protein
MRIVFTILFLFGIAKAQTFHVASAFYGGNDSNDGLTTETPWLTVAKVNATAGTGDFVYFHTDCSWNEQLRPAGSNMYFGAYGTGAKPILTGFQTITLADQGGNIWSGTATNAPPYLNTVLVNGSLSRKARFPNSGYLNFLSGTVNYIKTSTLTGTPDYTGYEAVVRTVAFITETMKITSQSLDTLRFQGVMNFTPVTTNNAEYNYFLQNKDSFLDTLGEYTFDSATKVLKVHYPSGGAAPTVYYSNKDTLVYFKNKNSITFDGLELTGSNDKGIRSDTSRNLSILNTTFNNHGKDAIYPRGSPQIILSKDTFTNCLNDGLFASHSSDTLTVDSCLARNIGMKEGMAASGNAAGVAFYSDSWKNTYTNNRVDSIGYIGISLEGLNSYAAYNYVTDYCMKKYDGGGIYMVNNNYGGGTVGSRITKNIIMRGQGYANCMGVYLDYGCEGVMVDSNTVFRTSTSAYSIMILGQDLHGVQGAKFGKMWYQTIFFITTHLTIFRSIVTTVTFRGILLVTFTPVRSWRQIK